MDVAFLFSLICSLLTRLLVQQGSLSLFELSLLEFIFAFSLFHLGSSSSKVGIIVVVIVVVVIVLTVGGWIFYAYKNPTSKSGIWLMEVGDTADKRL